MSEKPLSGLKVLDLSRVLAGPFAGQLLADLGARVIKVESPQGDDTRGWGPPFIDRQDGSRDAAYFHSCNRGKHSMIADLRNSDDLANVRALAAKADVVIQNFKVGGLKKFGLDHATLCQRHPALIYCSITGFGHSGPKCHQAGYDIMIQGLSGIMSITGEASGPPQKMGMAFADIFTGLYSVIAIQAALAARAMNYLASGIVPARMGNAHPNIVPYQAFAVADGYVIVAVGNDGQFKRFCRVLGRDELAQDTRFATNPDRVRNRVDLIAMLETDLQQWPRDELLAALEAATVPAGPIQDIGEALNDPQLLHRGMVVEREGIPGLASPIHLGGQAMAADLASPTLGNISFEEAGKLFAAV